MSHATAIILPPMRSVGLIDAPLAPIATTIFDFTRRAMPWPQPKSLMNDGVHALTAYILAINKRIGENDVMNKDTLAKVTMPNRDAFISRHPEKHEAMTNKVAVRLRGSADHSADRRADGNEWPRHRLGTGPPFVFSRI
jgi:hypothetical protein